VDDQPGKEDNSRLLAPLSYPADRGWFVRRSGPV